MAHLLLKPLPEISPFPHSSCSGYCRPTQCNPQPLAARQPRSSRRVNTRIVTYVNSVKQEIFLRLTAVLALTRIFPRRLMRKHRSARHAFDLKASANLSQTKERILLNVEIDNATLPAQGIITAGDELPWVSVVLQG